MRVTSLALWLLHRNQWGWHFFRSQKWFQVIDQWWSHWTIFDWNRGILESNLQFNVLVSLSLHEWSTSPSVVVKNTFLNQRWHSVHSRHDCDMDTITGVTTFTGHSNYQVSTKDIRCLNFSIHIEGTKVVTEANEIRSTTGDFRKSRKVGWSSCASGLHTVVIVNGVVDWTVKWYMSERWRQERSRVQLAGMIRRATCW